MLNPKLSVKKLQKSQKSQKSRDLGHSVWSGAQHWYFLKAPVVLMDSQDGGHVGCSSQLSSSFSHFQKNHVTPHSQQLGATPSLTKHLHLDYMGPVSP